MFGEVYPLPVDQANQAREIFLRHNTSSPEQGWSSGNQLFFRMHNILDIYFVGGFGTVTFLDVKTYLETQPDAVVQTDAGGTL